MSEQWAMHPEFPEYIFSSSGRVIRAVDSCKHQKAGDEIFGRVMVSGYRQFKLCHRDGGRRHVRANRLICEVFHGPAPSTSHHAAHNDGDRLNNSADNLRWATAKENYADQIRHGTNVYGERGGMAKLTNAVVAQIRLEAAENAAGSRRAIAEKYGIGASTASRVILGRGWAGVDVAPLPSLRRRSFREVLTPEQIASIRLEHAAAVKGVRVAGGTIDALARKAGISRSAVRRITSRNFAGQGAQS